MIGGIAKEGRVGDLTKMVLKQPNKKKREMEDELS